MKKRGNAWGALAGLAWALFLSGTASADPLQCPSGLKRHELHFDEWNDEWCEILTEGQGWQRHGPYRCSFTDGTPRIIGMYLYGKRMGEWRAWHPNGQKSSEMPQRHDKIHGVLKKWHANGQLSHVARWVDGHRDGATVTYYENGSVHIEARYVADLLNGTWRSYFENGQLAQSGEFRDGKESGHWVTWNGRGEKVEEGVTEAGRRHGTWMIVNRWTREVGEVTYDHGVIVRDSSGTAEESSDPICRSAAP